MYSNNQKHTLLTILLCMISIITSSCSVMQAIHLKDCQYSYSHISGITFMDMNAKNILSASGLIRVTQGLTGKTDKVPLGFTIHLDVQNPNKNTAAIEKVEYIIRLDSIQIAEGCNTEPFVVAGESKATLPLQLNIDLKQLLQRKSGPVLAKAIKNFLGISSQPTQVEVLLRPYFKVAGKPVRITNDIPIRFEYSGKKS